MTDPATMKSVQRIFNVLTQFAHEQRPLSSTEIARALNLPASSTLLLLKSMAQIGLLSFDGKGKLYFPTPELKYLVDWVDTKIVGSPHLTGLLNDLRDATQETVALSVVNDLDIVFVHIMPSQRPVALTVDVGSSRPLDMSAVGWMAMAEKSDSDLATLLRRLAERARREGRPFDVKEIEAEVHAARKTGYSVGYGLVSPDAGAIAMALPTAMPGTSYVIGVAGPLERLRAEEMTIIATMHAIDGGKA